MKCFLFHEDPGHGWLEVSMADLSAVNLTPNDFSSFSYERNTARGRRYFLEEDCDATVFITAYRRQHGRSPEHRAVCHHNSAPCRNYRHLRTEGPTMAALPVAY